MRRPFLIAFLALGTVAGFGSGIFHLVHHAHAGHRDAFERHVADICAESALRAASKTTSVAAAPAR